MDFNCYRFNPNNISEDRLKKGLPVGSDVTDIIGYNLWQDYGGQELFFDFKDYKDAVAFKNDLLTENKLEKMVFISHRQTDKKKALWLKKCFEKRNIRTWLDIIDLKMVTDHVNYREPIALANMIEIALLNCTHVIALMTPNSAGSAWIPYEFGRVKDSQLSTSNAAIFLHKLKTEDLPEYMQILNHQLRKENDIDYWI